MNEIKGTICEGCGEEMLFSPGLHDVCWDCVKARHRAAMSGKCTCRKKMPVTIKQAGEYRVKCKKCLGSITAPNYGRMTVNALNRAKLD